MNSTMHPDTPARALPAAQPPSDEALMARIAEPGASPAEIEAAVEHLVQRHAAALWRYFARRRAKPEEAEELVQEVFLRVVRERARFDAVLKFEPWLYTLARNLLISRGRSKQAERRALDGYAEVQARTAPDQEAPESRAANRDESRRMLEALGELREDDRELLRLARFEGLSYAQLGEIFGITPNAAKVRAFRALEKLRAILGVHARGAQETNP